MESPQWSVEELLQFLARDAKVPLAVAMSYVPKLKSSKLMSAKAIGELKKGGLDSVISDADHRKAITNAAKRVLKKSAAGGSPSKRKREDDDDGEPAPSKGRRGTASKPQQDFEKLITDAETDINKLEKITITINRAPFMLVFALVHTVLVHETSVASALSLAHSYISLNAVSKGRSIGIIQEKHGDDVTLREMLGGSTQPVIKVMSRDIAVVRQGQEGEYRAIDVHTLKERHKKREAEGEELYNIPTYTPEAASGYIQRAFGKDLPAVVGACLITMRSWLEGEGTEKEKEERRADLDKKGYGMYVQCRPEVPYGQQGWGKKGELSLAKILDLREKSEEEHAKDKRNKMSDEDGKQLSIEEAIEDADPKPKEGATEQEQDEPVEKVTKEAVRKARATNKDHDTIQLALEEAVEEGAKAKGSPATKKTSPKSKSASGKK